MVRKGAGKGRVVHVCCTDPTKSLDILPALMAFDDPHALQFELLGALCVERPTVCAHVTKTSGKDTHYDGHGRGNSRSSDLKGGRSCLSGSNVALIRTSSRRPPFACSFPLTSSKSEQKPP